MASDPCVLILFGATGDLARRKLLPALYRLQCEHMLPEHFAVVGFALPDPKQPDYPAFVHEAIEEFVHDADCRSDAQDELVKMSQLVPADFKDPEAYKKLAATLADVERERGTQGNRLI